MSLALELIFLAWWLRLHISEVNLDPYCRASLRVPNVHHHSFPRPPPWSSSGQRWGFGGVNETSPVLHSGTSWYVSKNVRGGTCLHLFPCHHSRNRADCGVLDILPWRLSPVPALSSFMPQKMRCPSFNLRPFCPPVLWTTPSLGRCSIGGVIA